MSKSIKKQKPKEKQLVEQTLYEAARRMDGKYPAETFIEKLLTESERNIIGRRLLISQMILAGKSQAEIRYEFSVSPNTFTRTRKWLLQQLPSYNETLEEYKTTQKLKEKTSENKKEPRPDYLSFQAMRYRYPGHFLLFNIAEELLKRK
jgi:Trp operon repressor